MTEDGNKTLAEKLSDWEMRLERRKSEEAENEAKEAERRLRLMQPGRA